MKLSQASVGVKQLPLRQPRCHNCTHFEFVLSCARFLLCARQDRYLLTLYRLHKALPHPVACCLVLIPAYQVMIGLSCYGGLPTSSLKNRSPVSCRSPLISASDATILSYVWHWFMIKLLTLPWLNFVILTKHFPCFSHMKRLNINQTANTASPMEMRTPYQLSEYNPTYTGPTGDNSLVCYCT